VPTAGQCLVTGADADCDAKHVCVTAASGLGECVTACVTSCPSGLGYLLFDGCHCKVPPTGADKCLVPGGWALCDTLAPGAEGYGQDGTFDGQTLAFTDLDDGTVRDEQTRVFWSCSLLSAGKTQAGAKSACEANSAGLPGSGRGVPGVHALFAMVDFGVTAPPFWSQAAFGDFGDWVTWSSTPAAAGGGTPCMYVDFSIGIGNLQPKATSEKKAVRCVRDAP